MFLATLILILLQLFLIALGLKVIFLLIDKAVLVYRRKTYQADYPNRNSAFKETLEARRKREEKATRLSKINRASKSQLSGREWNQLVAKVHGDSEIAERLINHLKAKHPGRSDRWYIEKAIFDLDRDRQY